MISLYAPVAEAQGTATPTLSSGNFLSEMKWSPNGKFLLTSKFNGEIQIRNVQNEIVSDFVLTNSYAPPLVFWSPDNDHLVASLSPYENLQFLDLQGKVTSTIDDTVIPDFSKSPVYVVAWSLNGHTLAIGHKSGVIQLWDSQTKQLTVLSGHSDAISSLAWSPDTKLLASGSLDKTAKIWTAQGQLVATLTKHLAPVYSVEWSNDGKLLLSTSNFIPLASNTGASEFQGSSTAMLWQPDGTFVAQIDKDEILWAIWQPKQNMIVTMNQIAPSIRFWDTKGTFIDSFPINAPEINSPTSIGWSPDGNYLAYCGTGIEVWTGDGKTQLAKQNFPDLDSTVTFLAWSPDSKFVALGTMNSEIKIWQVDVSKTN